MPGLYVYDTELYLQVQRRHATTGLHGSFKFLTISNHIIYILKCCKIHHLQLDEEVQVAGTVYVGIHVVQAKYKLGSPNKSRLFCRRTRAQLYVD